MSESDNDEVRDGSMSTDAALRRYLSLPPVDMRGLSAPPAPRLSDSSTSTVGGLVVDSSQGNTSSGGGMATTLTAQDAARFDQRLLAIEPALMRGDWREVHEILSQEDLLPPQLAFVHAIAMKETGVDEGNAVPLAIQSMASLLGVPEGNAAAVVVAKRALRQNPVAWRKRPAPPAKTSALLIFAIAVLGAGVGYLVSFGTSLPF